MNSIAVDLILEICIHTQIILVALLIFSFDL